MFVTNWFHDLPEDLRTRIWTHVLAVTLQPLSLIVPIRGRNQVNPRVGDARLPGTETLKNGMLLIGRLCGVDDIASARDEFGYTSGYVLIECMSYRPYYTRPSSVPALMLQGGCPEGLPRRMGMRSWVDVLDVAASPEAVLDAGECVNAIPFVRIMMLMRDIKSHQLLRIADNIKCITRQRQALSANEQDRIQRRIQSRAAEIDDLKQWHPMFFSSGAEAQMLRLREALRRRVAQRELVDEMHALFFNKRCALCA